MADKLAPQILDALTLAATVAETGIPLYSAKQAPGLFPNNSAGKAAAKRCLDEQWLHPVRNGEGHTITDSGLQFLLEQSSPKQILEDFVRILERRDDETRQLFAQVQQMSESLSAMRLAVGKVLPHVVAERVTMSRHAQPVSASPRSPRHPEYRAMTAVATLEAPTQMALELDDLTELLMVRLADWNGHRGVTRDCPLPELYRGLSTLDVPPTIGQFHDALRKLYEERRIYLHPWTGPLYSLPEPAFALLIGHEIAYYASQR